MVKVLTMEAAGEETLSLFTKLLAALDHCRFLGPTDDKPKSQI